MSCRCRGMPGAREITAPSKPTPQRNRAPRHNRSALFVTWKRNERDGAAVRRTSPVDKAVDTPGGGRMSREFFRFYEKFPSHRVFVQVWIIRLVPATASQVSNPNSSGLAPAPTKARQ